MIILVYHRISFTEIWVKALATVQDLATKFLQISWSFLGLTKTQCNQCSVFLVRKVGNSIHHLEFRRKSQDENVHIYFGNLHTK